MYIYIYIYLYMYIFMYVCMYACMHECMNVFMYVCNTYVCIIRMYIYIYILLHGPISRLALTLENLWQRTVESFEKMFQM
jgi:hypothetical protein